MMSMTTPEPLNPEALTWTALLGRWIEFAQASVALPADDPESARWKASVAPIINLQAVTFALADLEHLPLIEHPIARDKAAILIQRSEGELRAIWQEQDQSAALPEEVELLITDAHRALEQAATLQSEPHRHQ